MNARAAVSHAHRSLRHHWSSLLSLGMRGLGVIAGFAVTVAIGRWYGPAANGQYALVTQTAMFLSVVAVGGLDMAITRELSRAVAEQRKIARATFWRITGQAMLVALALAGVLLIAGSAPLRWLGRNAVPAGAIGILCLILLARALTRITAALLRSQKDYALGQAVEVVLIPLFTLAPLALGVARTVPEILWATAAAGLLAALIGMAASLRHTSAAADALRVSGRTVFATALPLWGVAIALNFAEWYSLATVSAVTGVYDAGLFRVAAQIASVLSIVTLGLFGTFSAQISAAVHAGDLDRVARLAGSATRLSAALVLPLAAAAFVFAPAILRLVGPEFAAATTLLRVLIAGQVVYAVTGPAGLVLALTGHPRVNLAITVTSTVALLVLAPLLAHRAGTLGIAAFVAAILALRNLASLIAVWRLERISVLTGGRAAVPQESP